MLAEAPIISEEGTHHHEEDPPNVGGMEDPQRPSVESAEPAISARARARNPFGVL